MKYIKGFGLFLWDFLGGVDSPEVTFACAALLVICLTKILPEVAGVWLLPLLVCAFLTVSVYVGKAQELKGK